VDEVVIQFRIHARMFHDHTASGGLRVFEFPGGRAEHQSDTTLLPLPQLTPECSIVPQLIVEVSVHNESFLGSIRSNLRFFQGVPLLCAFRLFDRQNAGTFDSVALLFRYNANGNLVQADLVSFDSVPLQVDRAWLATTQVQYRDLSGPAARLGGTRATSQFLRWTCSVEQRFSWMAR
jgi:hypothetical protein